MDVCERWRTTTSFEFQNPYSRSIRNYTATSGPDCPHACCPPEDDERLLKYCCTTPDPCEQTQLSNQQPNDQQQPVLDVKPSWCKCLPTGDPTCYDDKREEAALAFKCQCEDNGLKKGEYNTDRCKRPPISSTYFGDFRHPEFPYIENRPELAKFLRGKYEERKAAGPVPKNAKIKCTRGSENDEDVVECHQKKDYDAENECDEKKIDKFTWTTSYMEMNRDGAPLPILAIPVPDTSKENHGDPIKRLNVTTDRCPVVDPKDIGNVWDRMQLRSMARRCDTISNDPCLDRCCGDKDAYFQEQYLNRAKYATPTIAPEPISQENLKLVRSNTLRQPFDKMIPYYGGYSPLVAPPVCKIKKCFNTWDPYEMISVYQAEYNTDAITPGAPFYSEVKPEAKSRDERSCQNPINALSCKMPDLDAYRLSNYNQCIDCKDERDRIYCSRFAKGQNTLIEKEVPQLEVMVGGVDKCYPVAAEVAVPCQYQQKKKEKENLLEIGTYVPSKADHSIARANLLTKKEFKACG